jgi:hypothetical protein
MELLKKGRIICFPYKENRVPAFFIYTVYVWVTFIKKLLLKKCLLREEGEALSFLFKNNNFFRKALFVNFVAICTK